jgi:(+)-trans-carveol dehydrogenase/(-)-trans-carveol dehydrogenase
MGKVEGKVAFVTGAARGQGRSHAQSLAEQGADIIALDVLADGASVGYPAATQDDLAETVAMVQKVGRKIYARHGDVRNQSDVDAAVAEGLARFGHLDIVVANAGITTFGAIWELTDDQWGDMIDVNLTGVFHSVKAAVPAMLEQGSGGSIVITGSCAVGLPHLAHYSAAKNGVVGLMRSLASELAPYKIRANVVHPTTVGTEMIFNDATYRVFRPDLDTPTVEDLIPVLTSMNKLGVPWVDPVDISNAVLWLASDDARYVTGAAIPVDAGVLLR